MTDIYKVIYEVEMKFPLASWEALEEKLLHFGAQFEAARTEWDVYFAHPLRGFAQTDEALRVRRRGNVNLLTYKGPRRGTTAKTRREIEVSLGEGEAAALACAEIFAALGFKPVAQVRKIRRPFTVPWEKWSIHGALDDVESLGLFLELELVVDQPHVAAAEAAIASLASHVGLTDFEQRSYLELLAAKSANTRKGLDFPQGTRG